MQQNVSCRRAEYQEGIAQPHVCMVSKKKRSFAGDISIVSICDYRLRFLKGLSTYASIFKDSTLKGLLMVRKMEKPYEWKKAEALLHQNMFAKARWNLTPFFCVTSSGCSSASSRKWTLGAWGIFGHTCQWNLEDSRLESWCSPSPNRAKPSKRGI